MKELAKQYDPSQVEDRIYQFWLDGGYFHTKADPDKKPYTIVMPPPNVTGQLHMGHAVDNTMQEWRSYSTMPLLKPTMGTIPRRKRFTSPNWARASSAGRLIRRKSAWLSMTGVPISRMSL